MHTPRAPPLKAVPQDEKHDDRSGVGMEACKGSDRSQTEEEDRRYRSHHTSDKERLSSDSF